MNKELKPCPLCATEADFIEDAEDEYVWCVNVNCPLHIKYEFTENDWNKRPVEDALRVRADNAEAALDNNERSAFCDWCGKTVAKYTGPMSEPKDPEALAAMLNAMREHQRTCEENPLCAELVRKDEEIKALDGIRFCLENIVANIPNRSYDSLETARARLAKVREVTPCPK